jgi:hypothetical protein
MDVFETDELSRLIDAKCECLQKLRDIGGRQLELIDGGEITALLDLLSVKQRLLVQLQGIEKALDPFRDQDPQQRRWPSSEDRRRCARQLECCETLLGEIISQEKRGENSLIRRRDEAAKQLQGAYRATQARGAYASGQQQDTCQLDLRSDR